MVKNYLRRRRQRVIEVTYESGAVRTYGPLPSPEEAHALLASRLVPTGTTTLRGRAIQSARVTRIRTCPDHMAESLLGVRLVEPSA